MIGTSPSEYAFIRLCIFGLHYLAPLCILYCVFIVACYGAKATLFRFPLAVEIYAAAETLFFFLVYLPYRHYLQRDAVHPPPPSREERRILFNLCHDNIADPVPYFEKWFEDADIAEIKRENMKDFFLWAFFNRGGPPGDDDEELEEYITTAEKILGITIEPGKGNAKALRLTLDRVDMLHRSLAWYSCVGFVDSFAFAALRYHGFHFHRSPISQYFRLFPIRVPALFTTHRSPAKYTSYWYRPHTSTTKLPVVFIHGIGIGLHPYVRFLSDLSSTRGGTYDPNDQIGVLAVEIMPVSFRLTHHALPREEMCAEISAIVSRHFGDRKFVLASHSYGTVISTHLLASPLAPQIGPVFLIDPVCILLHLPDVAFNFTRRKPAGANEHQLYYFASMDMGVAHTLARCFFWYENILWKKDVAGRKITISLGGRDLIVNAEAVGRYWSSPIRGYEKVLVENGSSAIPEDDGVLVDVNEEPQPEARMRGGVITTNHQGEEEWKYKEWTGTGTELVWFDGIDHAQAFDDTSTRLNIVHKIHRYCADGQIGF